jgi:hypothetical protein
MMMSMIKSGMGKLSLVSLNILDDDEDDKGG